MMILLVILYVIVFLTCGELWRGGGDGEKWLRMILLPLVIASFKLCLLIPDHGFMALYALIYAPLLWGMMQLFSYGLTAPPHKFVVWLNGGQGANGNDLFVEIATRALVGFFWSLAGCIFAIVDGNWIMFGVYVIFLTCANGYFGGMYKDVELSERRVGNSVALALLI